MGYSGQRWNANKANLFAWQIYFQLSFLKMNMYRAFCAAVIDLLVLDLLAGVLEGSLWLLSSISLYFVLIAHWLGKMFILFCY